MSSTGIDDTIAIAIFRGTSQEDVVTNRAWNEMFSAGVPDIIRERIEASAQLRQHVEVQLRWKSLALGSPSRSIRVVVQPFGDNDVMATCIDQSELKRAREEAAHVTELKERVLAAVTHEVRGTLSTILLWERVLREQYNDPEVRARALEAIRESAAAQSDVVGELRQISTRDTGIPPAEHERIAIEALLATAAEMQSSAARARNVEIRSSYKLPLGHIVVDRARLRRALEMLIQARLRATPAGGSFTIAAHRDQDTLLVLIGDVDREHASDMKIEAFPLSLVVAGEIVALHGGALEATRPSHGGPPTFRVRLHVVPRSNS
jgi:signal transduction histidine kinase